MMLSRCVVSQVKHNSYFLVGLCLGLWVSLAVIPLEDEPAACTAPVNSAAGSGRSLGAVAGAPEEFEPHHEEKPMSAGGQAAGRSVQRPRYYSTELGMRGSLLTGVLSSEEALKNQVPALNRTAARLQPALKFFITASAMSSVPGLANVVGFTDTREMLKPFHALKYLADNYLEEYDFFFLVSDTAFINARRLNELVSKLSVSQDVYMGTVAEDDSHYCSLENGILLSNSVLRAIHGSLDWCVRNSYSPHHHENIGRCVLHAAHRACAPVLQAQRYTSARVKDALTLDASLADAVTIAPLDHPNRFYQLHAYISRVHLERDAADVRRLRAFAWRNSARHPPHYRNSTWPGGLRDDPGLARPLPDNRFDHLRWTPFNATHAFMPDDHRNVVPITGAHKEALDLVMREVRAWALRRWPSALDVQVSEGAWRWEPAVALRYRLVLRLTSRTAAAGVTLRAAEVARALGAARLVPVRYVTESARITMVLPVPRTAEAAADALLFLQRYDAVCLAQDKNTALLLVFAHHDNSSDHSAHVRAALGALVARYPAAQLDVRDTQLAGDALATAGELRAAAHAAALALALAHVPRDALLLMCAPHMEFNQDFLNRVRMNTISGEQWFLPVPFSRYSQYDHPAFLTPTGQKPQVNTGRFNYHHHDVIAFYRSDYDSALAEWAGAPDASAAPAAARLARAALRCVRAPEPGLVLHARAPPCLAVPVPAAVPAECARALRAARPERLDLGAKHALAQLLLERQAERGD